MPSNGPRNFTVKPCNTMRTIPELTYWEVAEVANSTDRFQLGLNSQRQFSSLKHHGMASTMAGLLSPARDLSDLKGGNKKI